jgi:redox-sensitive bicupin YhaK (pirin superfamily)
MAMTDTTTPNASDVETILDSQRRDLGGFEVGRVLPSAKRRHVGPFVFVDQMGPAILGAGKGLDVRPHPHIHLATVTYLYEGAIMHRDSVGSAGVITPGDVNWMHAGCGIVHSERSPNGTREVDSPIYGIQLWVALPTRAEETDPTFQHHAKGTLPAHDEEGVALRLIAGDAYGKRAPVVTQSPLFCVDLVLAKGTAWPMPNEHEERCVYVASGAIVAGGERAETGRMLVFRPGAEIALRAEEDSRVMLLGGAPLDGPRYMWWNFVSSSKERIEQAKSDWKNGRFPSVPGEGDEFIPLPE